MTLGRTHLSFDRRHNPNPNPKPLRLTAPRPTDGPPRHSKSIAGAGGAPRAGSSTVKRTLSRSDSGAAGGGGGGVTNARSSASASAGGGGASKGGNSGEQDVDETAGDLDPEVAAERLAEHLAIEGWKNEVRGVGVGVGLVRGRVSGWGVSKECLVFFFY